MILNTNLLVYYKIIQPIIVVFILMNKHKYWEACIHYETCGNKRVLITTPTNYQKLVGKPQI